MKRIIRRFILLLGQLSFAAHQERLSEFQFPLTRMIAMASFGCLATLMFIYWVARPVVESSQDWWTELLVDALIPVLVTFIILYRSNWHRELSGVARMRSLLLVSFGILGGLLAIIGASFFVVSFLLKTIPAGVGGR